MPEKIKQLASANLIVEGRIDAPMKYQEDKGVMLVPLQSGSGIRAKIVEGLALGKIIISTTIGAQGIKCTHGKDILIADTPAGFLEMIRFCYQNPDRCRAISKNARLLAENIYHYEKTALEMIKFYNSFYEEN
jgi:glycosyltransferase involved in cell wall biosynthesis